MNIEFVPADPAETAKAENRFRTLVASHQGASNEEELRSHTAAVRLHLFDEALRLRLAQHKPWVPERSELAAAQDLDLWKACCCWMEAPDSVQRWAHSAKGQELWLHGSDPTPIVVDDIPTSERIGAIYEDRRRYIVHGAGGDLDQPWSSYATPTRLWVLPRLLLWSGALEYHLMTECLAGWLQFALDASVATTVMPLLDARLRTLANLQPPKRSIPRTTALKAVLAAQDLETQGQRLRESLLQIYERAFLQAGGDRAKLQGFSDGALRTALSRERKKQKMLHIDDV